MDQKSDMNTQQEAHEEDLTGRFVVLVLCLIIVLALLCSFATYVYTRVVMQQQDLQTFEASLVGLGDRIALNRAEDVRRVGIQMLGRSRISKIAFFSPDTQLVWSSPEKWVMDTREKAAVVALLKPDTPDTSGWDDINELFDSPGFATFADVLRSSETRFIGLSVVRANDGSPLVVIKALRDYRHIVATARYVAIWCFVVVLLTSILVFVITTRLFRRNIMIIKNDEDILNDQVSQLSALLEENKQLQRNMKSASSRAVELNERFLRRVGSDLHDGPAQSIGYSVLRLNQVSSKQISEELGYEFHAIKEALNESLEEIRGISSGLVLPELEQMTLEEAIRKVIQRHVRNTGTEVKENYFDLPDDIALPIKICAYRFAQEGLNNAYKHGNAKKCRFTAQMIGDVLHLSLKDNGMGFRKSVLNSDGGHLGLIGLKDRIESIGGKLNINSELGVGTAIKVSVQIFGYD